MATLSWPARAPKIIRQRSATCCGVPYEDSHFSSCVRSAGSNSITRLVFGMSEILAIAEKSVKLFKGHYTRSQSTTGSLGQFVLSWAMQAKVQPSFGVNCRDHNIRPESISSATMASLVFVEGSE